MAILFQISDNSKSVLKGKLSLAQNEKWGYIWDSPLFREIAHFYQLHNYTKEIVLNNLLF